MRVFFEHGRSVFAISLGADFNWFEVNEKGRGVYRLGILFLVWYFNICFEV